MGHPLIDWLIDWRLIWRISKFRFLVGLLDFVRRFHGWNFIRCWVVFLFSEWIRHLSRMSALNGSQKCRIIVLTRQLSWWVFLAHLLFFSKVHIIVDMDLFVIRTLMNRDSPWARTEPCLTIFPPVRLIDPSCLPSFLFRSARSWTCVRIGKRSKS